MRTTLTIVGTFAAVFGLAWSARSADPAPTKPPTEAVAVITPTKGHKAHGAVVLKQQDGSVRVTGTIEGLSPGDHGFHIHEFGDLRGDDGMAAGSHYSPREHKHGSPDDSEHHAGDLGNISANGRGIATIDKTYKDLELHFVVGRALVVHEKADDFKSQPAGDAGARAGLGVIGFASKKSMTADKLKSKVN